MAQWSDLLGRVRLWVCWRGWSPCDAQPQYGCGVVATQGGGVRVMVQSVAAFRQGSAWNLGHVQRVQRRQLHRYVGSLSRSRCARSAVPSP